MYATKNAAAAARIYAEASAPSPLKDLVNVHDAMIGKLRDARRAMVEGRVAERYRLTRQIADVIEALHMSLDHANGGDVAAGLSKVYAYAIVRLCDINLKQDAAICDELVARFSELRDAWHDVMLAPPSVTPAEGSIAGCVVS